MTLRSPRQALLGPIWGALLGAWLTWLRGPQPSPWVAQQLGPQTGPDLKPDVEVPESRRNGPQ